MSLLSPWTACVWLEFHARTLTRGARDVLLTLATFQGPDGIYPSHETLADRARCSVKTVQRALALARELGAVTWTERRVRAGWRWLRTSNAYRLHVPGVPSVPPAGRCPATTGQKVGGGERLSKKEALSVMLAAAGDAVTAQAALATIAAERERLAAAAWFARRAA